MTLAILGIALVLLVAGAAVGLARRRERPITPEGARRILFPFVGRQLSKPALDAALRLARAEDATLVPAYLAEVPLNLPLESALPKECEAALPVLEAIEQRAARSGVAVDSRIERGRTSRHALAELIGHEHFDRIVAPAATAASDGFSADDIAWLLDHAGGEIVVFRAGPTEGASRTRAATPSASAAPTA
jgi:Universal stress protein family